VRHRGRVHIFWRGAYGFGGLDMEPPVTLRGPLMEAVFDGKECALETAITADFALMRATAADRWGNVSFRGTQSNFGPAMAMASRVAVVEVDTVTDLPLPTREIDIPGIFTQRIIAVPDER